ncbi:hypothetical protein RvY_04407 [Ramazzottius varieornatus]|uniref:Uncharacterized protein n=1 Tax=Ramazzottius varieornatus TaxID=947166 RepID=A0A1D1US88_RAMVA|nr:hypothetical protein RvY_04407 [Ramazzottius varieornatus]
MAQEKRHQLQTLLPCSVGTTIFECVYPTNIFEVEKNIGGPTFDMFYSVQTWFLSLVGYLCSFVIGAMCGAGMKSGGKSRIGPALDKSLGVPTVHDCMGEPAN